jgi:hypothetical protein
MPVKRTEKNYCFKHHRDKVPTRAICPQCMGSITSPKRRRAALAASRAAAAKRALVRTKKEQRAKRPGRVRGEGKLDEIF